MEGKEKVCYSKVAKKHNVLAIVKFGDNVDKAQRLKIRNRHGDHLLRRRQAGDGESAPGEDRLALAGQRTWRMAGPVLLRVVQDNAVLFFDELVQRLLDKLAIFFGKAQLDRIPFQRRRQPQVERLAARIR